MMVTFVSQCEKNALKKTRRVLDAFANRIGDNTWQTVITEDGLNTVKKMLRHSATKSTAVSCHWIRSRSRSQFLWVVGNKRRFTSEGYVAVNSTEKDLINDEFENSWKYLPLIKSLTAIAALFHDWGKASTLFQNKLAGKSKHRGDPIRHEWLSCMLFHGFVHAGGLNRDDGDWIQRLIDSDIDEEHLKRAVKTGEAQPLCNLPEAASLVAWLIVSHHRMPLLLDSQRVEGKKNANLNVLLRRIDKQWGYENKYDESEYNRLIDQCFDFPNGLLSTSTNWLKALKLWAATLQQHLPLLDDAMHNGSWRLILHHSRLCLMLGDHYYSSQGADQSWRQAVGLYANTDRQTNELKQKLDEHLVRVAYVALNAVRMLPYFESEPHNASDIEALKPQKDTPKKFKWQDKAVKQIHQWKAETESKITGFFAVNMASTGCGKTLANAKIMQALATDAKSLRYVLALGLRTLTLQTGDEYKNRIGLDDTQLAVLIGSKAILELHQKAVQVSGDDDTQTFEEAGSESLESLLDEEVNWQGVLPEDELTTVLTSEKDRKLLYAPVLACTIDHMMAATETKRGGRYILPCLRLMSSDLVIDEVDDFTGSDLIAIGRLIYLTGMLGRKVMISSATIPPDLAEGYFNAYRQGWALFAASRSESNKVGCAWVDEFSTKAATVSTEQSAIDSYRALHNGFINKRVARLKKETVKRKAVIQPCPMEETNNKQTQYFDSVKQAIVAQHLAHHTIDEQTGTMVSFGVVRVANIPPCIALTKHLMTAAWPENIEIRTMAYHSQQVLLLRHTQEQHLDDVLRRKEKPNEQPKAFNNPLIRAHIDNNSTSHLVFILVATPVEEVGRDHDFDWAVVEPSSYRSIIQLAGRVRRHREQTVEQANISLMQFNLKGYEGHNEHAYCRPGYESRVNPLVEHDLTKLVDEEQLNRAVSAVPRIQKPFLLEPTTRLADLEHAATARWLTQYDDHKPKSLAGYLNGYWWLTALPQKLAPFRQSEPSIKLFLKVDGNAKVFHEKSDAGGYRPVESVYRIKHTSLPNELTSKLWLRRDYLQLVNNEVSEQYNATQTSVRYGEISLTIREGDNEYVYNDQFGLVKA